MEINKYGHPLRFAQGLNVFNTALDRMLGGESETGGATFAVAAHRNAEAFQPNRTMVVPSATWSDIETCRTFPLFRYLTSADRRR